MAVHFEYKGQHFELPDGTTPEAALSKIKSHLGEEVAPPEEVRDKLKADIESIPGVPEQPTPAPEPSLLEKAHASIEAAGNIVSSAAWGVGALPYGLIKSTFTDKTKEQEAEAAMAANPLLSKGELTQEYTKKAGETLARYVPPVLPAAGGMSIGTRMSTLINQRKAFKELSKAEQETAIKEVQKESSVFGRELSPDEINKILNLPEAVHINAKKKADALIKEGANTKKVQAIVEKHPLVGHYLEEYRTRYEQFASTIGKPTKEVEVPTKAYPGLTKEGETPLPAEEVATTGLTKREGLEVPTQEVKSEAPVTPVKPTGPVGTAGLLERGLGTLNTRLHNADPEVGLRQMETEMKIKQDTHRTISASDEALSYLEKDVPIGWDRLKDKLGMGDLAVKEALSSTIKNKWLNNDRGWLTKYAEQGGEKIARSMQALFKADDEVGQALASRGLAELREDHLPRIVKDREGLLNSLGFSIKQNLTKALEAEAKKQGTKVDMLDDLSYSKVINKELAKGKGIGLGKAGLTKGRVFETITPEMQKHYYDPVETMHTYLERAWTEVHKSDFFGKSVATEAGKVDVDTSIGNYLADKVAKGELEAGSAKWNELQQVLEARWKYGHLYASETVQNAKNLATLATISNPVSAGMQIADYLTAPAYYGFKPAMIAAAQALTGKKKFSGKDFGIADHISEDFIGTSTTQRMTDVAMKLSFWKILDPMGKTFQLNTSLNRGISWSKSPVGLEKLQNRYADAFGKDYPALVADLQAGKDTHLTRLMAFWDVAQHQPLTKMQRTEAHIKNPDVGGLMYHLKSFMIMQADFARRNAYNQIKEGVKQGNPRKTQEGFKSLALIAGAWLSVGASQKAIKNFLLGNNEDVTKEDIISGALGQVGFNQFAYEEVKRGRPGAAAGMLLTPAAVSIPLSIAAKPEEASRYTPLIGRWLAEQNKANKERKKAVEKELK